MKIFKASGATLNEALETLRDIPTTDICRGDGAVVSYREANEEGGEAYILYFTYEDGWIGSPVIRPDQFEYSYTPGHVSVPNKLLARTKAILEKFLSENSFYRSTIEIDQHVSHPMSGDEYKDALAEIAQEIAPYLKGE